MSEERAPTIMEIAPTADAEPIAVDMTAPGQRAAHIANILESLGRPASIEEIQAETGLSAAKIKTEVHAARYLQLVDGKVAYA